MYCHRVGCETVASGAVGLNALYACSYPIVVSHTSPPFVFAPHTSSDVTFLPQPAVMQLRKDSAHSSNLRHACAATSIITSPVKPPAPSKADHTLTRRLILQAPLLLFSQWAAPAVAEQPVRYLPPLLDLKTDYDKYSASYDALDGGAASSALGFPQLREELLPLAKGDVLEVAVGTGLNLPYYNWSNIANYTGIDLSPGMLEQAQQRALAMGIRAGSPEPQPAAAGADGGSSSSSSSSSSSPSSSGSVRLLEANAASLPLPSASFDSVVSTFSLCVIDQPLAALQEVARVLRPGGQALLIEHSRSDNPLLGAYQDLTEPLVTPMSKGCVWNQDLPALMAKAGLTPIRMDRHLQGTIVSIVAGLNSDG